MRKPLGVRDWQAAQIRARELEATGDTGLVQVITLETATDHFEKDAATLKPPTLRKYKSLLRELREFCKSRGISSVKQISVVDVREFRNSWKLSARTAANQLSRLKRFFNFCVENEWLEQSPARALKAPKISDNGGRPIQRRGGR